MREKFKLVALLLILIMTVGCASPATETQAPVEREKKEKSSEDAPSDSGVPPELENIQKQVDDGQETWRLDPIAVTKESVIGDSFTLIKSDNKTQAIVEVKRDDEVIHVYLNKPVRQDKTGIWAVERVEEK